MGRVALTALLVALLAAPSAAAHSQLVESTPGHEQVTEAPDELVLTFSDPVAVDPDGVRVFDLAGNAVETGEAQVDSTVVRVPVEDSGTGTRLVAWRAVSDHGSPISGAFVYHAGARSAAAAAPAAGGTAAGEWSDLARALALAGLGFAAVAGLGLALAARRGSRLVPSWSVALVSAAVLAALGGLGAFWFGGAVAAGGAVADGPERIGSWATSTYGLAALAVVAAALLAVAVRHLRVPRLLAGAAAAAVLVVTLGGFAYADPPAQAPAATEREVTLPSGLTASVSVEPAVAGANRVSVELRENGEPFSGVEQVYLRYAPQEHDAGALARDLAADGPGRFAADDLTLPLPGLWTVELHVVLDLFTDDLVTFELDVQPNRELAR